MPQSDHSLPRLAIDDAEPAEDGSVPVILAGEFDRDETGRFETHIAGLVRQHAPAPIRIDATAVSFLDSAGINALLVCRDLAERAGSALSIPVASPVVFQVLQITELLSLFHVGEPERQAS
ncbi:STAS domain-containing protein [Actinoplanes sp. NPDC023714]|uniref:STAS domain-containing protein n=1 Tax=Actinoplanes sp. NPDC023714 TaxID=3154322 RepID=UPI0033CE0233